MIISSVQLDEVAQVKDILVLRNKDISVISTRLSHLDLEQGDGGD